MIDCGSSDIDSVARYRVAPYVLSRGYDRIDYAVLTHPDEDHISGYLELLDMGSESGLRIGCFIIPDVPCESENMELLLEKAGERGIRVMKIKAGDSFHVGRAGFYCLNPDEGARYQDMNEISVCLSIELRYKTAFYSQIPLATVFWSLTRRASFASRDRLSTA